MSVQQIDIDAFVNNPAVRNFSGGRRWKILQLMALSCKYFEPGIIEFMDADIRVALGLSLSQWYVLRDIMELKGMLKQVEDPHGRYYELAPWLFPGQHTAPAPADWSHADEVPHNDRNGASRPVGRPRRWADNAEKNAYHKACERARSEGKLPPDMAEFVQQRRLERCGNGAQQHAGDEINSQDSGNFVPNSDTKFDRSPADSSPQDRGANFDFAPRSGGVVVVDSSASLNLEQQQTTEGGETNFVPSPATKFFADEDDNFASGDPDEPQRRRQGRERGNRNIEALSEEVQTHILAFCKEIGFSDTRMDWLIGKCGIEKCRQQIEWYPARLKEKKWDSPVGMLHQAIAENWPEPAGYVEAEQDKRDREQREAQRQAGQARLEAERAAKDAFLATVQEALSSCTPERRQEIEQMALDLIAPVIRGKIELLRSERKDLGGVHGATWNKALGEAVQVAFPDLFPGQDTG